MTEPPSDFSHLWNDLPYEERMRLMPYSIQSQLLHIWQCKLTAIAAHKAHMKELDDWAKNLSRELEKHKPHTKGRAWLWCDR